MNKQKLKIENLESKLESNSEKIYNMKNEIKNVKYDLNLIKSRGAFKSFIDFFLSQL